MISGLRAPNQNPAGEEFGSWGTVVQRNPTQLAAKEIEKEEEKASCQGLELREF
jgi:hypothetical protein